MITEPLEKVMSQKVTNEEKDYLLGIISKNTTRLVDLINQVLDFSTIQYEGLTLNIQKVELISFLTAIIDSFWFESKRKEVEIKLETTLNKLDVYIDKEKIERVIFNLLSNSFKHTNPNDNIYISVMYDKQNSQFILGIEDTGEGIKKEQLKNLFNRFFKVEKESNGQGIGLSIVKEYVEAHEGQIRIDSEYGKGTKTIIKLPTEEKDVKLKGELSNQPINDLKNANSILIVEDDDELRDYLTYELSSEYRLYTAKNGLRGLEIAKDKIPDVIITDYMMPQMTGLDLCLALKEHIKTSHIPIIMITAAGTSETLVLKNGANDFIKKPFKIKNLKLKLRNQLSVLQRTKDWVERELHLIPQPNDFGESNETKFIKKLMNVIEENFMEDKLSISLLTQKMGVSKSVLYKKTSQLTGYTVNELITSIRLKNASELIINTEHTFSEITYMVGYNDLKYFRSLFKKKYNMTMREYRKKHKY